MKRKDKENLGFVYYVEQGLNAKETAEKCGVTEKTVGMWVSKGNWKTLRAAKESAPQKLLSSLYQILSSLTEKRIKAEKDDDAVSLNRITDEIRKISKTIEMIRKDDKPSLRTHVYCVEQFIDKLLPQLEKYNLRSEITDFTKEYCSTLAKEL